MMRGQNTTEKCEKEEDKYPAGNFGSEVLKEALLYKGHRVQTDSEECSTRICSITETKVSSNTRPLRTRAFHFAILTKAYAHIGPHTHTHSLWRGGLCNACSERGREGVSAEASAFGG